MDGSRHIPTPHALLNPTPRRPQNQPHFTVVDSPLLRRTQEPSHALLTHSLTAWPRGWRGGPRLNTAMHPDGAELTMCMQAYAHLSNETFRLDAVSKLVYSAEVVLTSVGPLTDDIVASRIGPPSQYTRPYSAS